MRNESRNNGWLGRWSLSSKLLVCFLILAGAFSLNTAAYAAPNWHPIAGGTSSDAPALVFYHGIPIMAIRANDSTGAMWYSINKENWQRVANGDTEAAPVLALWNDEVIIVHTGEDGNGYFMMLDHSSPNVSNWNFPGFWFPLPGFNGQLAPTLRLSLTFDGARLYVFGTYLDRSMHYTTTIPNIYSILEWSADSEEIPGGGFTNSSIAAVADGDVVTVYQTGTDGNGYINTRDFATQTWVHPSWVQLPTIDQRMKFGPTALLTGDGNQGMCAVDPNLLAIDCMSLKVTGRGLQYTPVISYKNIPWNVGTPIPFTQHSVTLAYAGNGLVALAATVQNPKPNLPEVWLSDPAPFPSLIAQ